ncbi:MAG TPA: DUF2948 family protein [Caulobacteraceae bacterium]|jgi:hypothetical protein
MKDSKLRLLAEDADDLAVISAALQDAVTRIGDISWERRGQRLTIAFSRFRWEAADHGGERVLAALQLGGVQSVRARNLRREAKNAVLELLALNFEAGEPPGGRVLFAFADGGDLAVEVECVDAALADLCSPWRAPHKPGHQT